MSKIEYINNDITLGIKYNWSFIMREFKKLQKNVPETVYQPNPPFESVNWVVELSERSVGKTTQYLLIGLLLNKHYGTRIEYVRLKEEQSTRKNVIDMFKTIRELGYIQKIYNEKWNDLIYDSKRWYLCRRDENGDVIEKSNDAVCMIHSVDKADNIKSTYNSPYGDFIILDEFIRVTGTTTEFEFLEFCQIVSTIRRLRLSVKVILLANTINPYTQFFHELCISKEILKLKSGQSNIVKTPLGTSIYIHKIGFNVDVAEKRHNNNLKYFGFLNTKLASITGGGEWEVKTYPHLPRKERDEKRTLLNRDLYIKFYDTILCLEIWNSDIMGIYMFIREQTSEIYDYSKTRLYTLDVVLKKYERHKLGNGDAIDRLIWNFYKSGKMFFSYNDVGAIFEQYINQCK